MIKYLIVLMMAGLVGCGMEKDPGATLSVPPQMPEQYDILEIVDPCGDAPGIIDEVLLRLHSGQVLVLFADNVNGKNPRLALLPPGSYQTSDGSNCHFSVDASGNIN